jgi:hypothetical protein
MGFPSFVTFIHLDVRVLDCHAVEMFRKVELVLFETR